MRNLTIIFAIIFLIFGGCSTTKKVLKSKTSLEFNQKFQSKSSVDITSKNVNIGKTSIEENSNFENITIKKNDPIELTANFKIDSSATLNKDTVIKLVDVCDKSVSLTIYRNNKTKELTAKVRSHNKVQDVPFSEINIQRYNNTKKTSIDTAKTIENNVSAQSSTNTQTLLKSTKNELKMEVKRFNYLPFLIVVFVALGAIFFIKRN